MKECLDNDISDNEVQMKQLQKGKSEVEESLLKFYEDMSTFGRTYN